MHIDRTKADTPNVNALSVSLSGLGGPCVGCTECVGLCQALIDALVVPDIVLAKKREGQ